MNAAIAIAESAILACLIVYPTQACPYAGENCLPAMFSRPNAAIYNATLKVFADGDEGLPAITRELSATGELDFAGGTVRLHELYMAAIPPILLPHYAKTLRDELARRRLVKTMQRLSDSLIEKNCSNVGDVIAEGILEFEAIANARNEHNAPTIKALVMEAIGNIKDRATGLTRGISTGIASLDRVTGGVRPGSQWVVAGPAKGGKSSLALTMLASLAMKHHCRCALFGLEMPSVENVERLLCHDGQVSAEASRDGLLNDYQLLSLQQSSSRISGAPIHCRDDLFELVEIISVARQLKSSFPDLFAIFVDYAQLVGAEKEGENREREVATVSRVLRKFSMKTGVAVILLSQTNDDGKLRESRALGMDATKIITIEFGETPHTRKLKLTQRDGMSGITLDVAYRGDHFQFAELAK